jgi:hypothetical protein
MGSAAYAVIWLGSTFVKNNRSNESKSARNSMTSKISYNLRNRNRQATTAYYKKQLIVANLKK